MKKLLVTGISGFLGEFIAQHIQGDWSIIGTFQSSRPDFTEVDLHQIDLTDTERLNRFLEEINPDAILHLAANSNPNKCELDTSSETINVAVPTRLSQYCAQENIPFVFTSTDLVFDGEQALYVETDTPNPIMRYGAQKARAEQAVLAAYPRAIIARMPLLYGLPKNGKGFLSNWVNKLKNGEKIHCFSDEYRTALSGVDAAKNLFLLLGQQEVGVFHLGGPESMSRYDFAYQVANHFGLDTDLIIPVLQKDVSMPAARPADVSLGTLHALFKPNTLKTYLKFNL